MSKHLVDQLRALADRLEAADQERAEALDELWHIQTVDIEQSAHGHAPADGAGATGEAESLGGLASPAAPISDAGAVRDGRRATSSEGAGSTPAPRSKPAPAAHKPKSHPPKDDEDGRVIDEACPKCDRRFTWKPALSNHLPNCRGSA